MKYTAHGDKLTFVLDRRFRIGCAKDYRIYAGIASLVTYDDLAKAVQQAGLFLLTQHGKYLELVNTQVHCF